MLDFDSEIFIWIGSAVPKDKIVTCFKHVGNACMGVHGKGKRRAEAITFSVVYQGFEPHVFTQAFAAWEPFKKAGADDAGDEIQEESEESDSNSDRS